MKTKNLSELTDIAQFLRGDILSMVYGAKCGHFGGPLSAIDLMVGIYFYKMKYDPKNPTWDERDRFVLSPGHTCAGLYAVLSRLGVFPRDLLKTFRKLGSPLQGHPKYNLELGIEMSTGSLGQGMSVANGMALGMRLQNKQSRVYSLESDGGCQEGMFWEGAMTAAHYKLDNRCIVFDYNNIQIDGFVSDVMGVEPIADKLKAFNWHVIDIDGHDMQQICQALDEAEATKGRPTAIIGRTILGKGVSIFENKSKYHGVAPSDAEYQTAMTELNLKNYTF